MIRFTPSALLFWCLLGSSSALFAETKITLNKSSASNASDFQQVTIPAGERLVLFVPVLSGNVWFKNGQPIPDADGQSLVIESVTTADSGRYRLAYAGDAVSASQELLLTVAPSSGNNSVRLQTFSTRGNAGSGAQSLVSGFIVGSAAGESSATKQIMVRAVGPALEDLGVSGFLAHPRLAVFDSAGHRIQTTTTDPLVFSKMALRTGAFPVKPNGGDSLALFTVSAGSYTAQVSAPDGESGIVLLEVYEIPSE